MKDLPEQPISLTARHHQHQASWEGGRAVEPAEQLLPRQAKGQAMSWHPPGRALACLSHGRRCKPEVTCESPPA